ncbi:TetR/AcrR family transcriptional regulator [Sphingomonas sp. Leaf208]|uniref:TetR/AcrR family transcriptional regulator n=1 Tax=Sphingomonas sp. Leaf208 TaxID=1735679 RepID=UPI0009E8043C
MITFTTRSPPGTRLSYERRRSQLIDIAWLIIKENGEDSLTLKEVAKHARITPPIIYRYFTDKLSLINETKHYL